MANNQVNGVNFSKYKNEDTGWPTSRINILMTDNTTFDILQLNGPPRVVLDIKGASLAIDGNEVVVNDGMVKKIRWSQFQSDIVRFVMDLEIQGRCDIYHGIPEEGNSKVKNQLVIDIQRFYLNVWDHINKKIVTQSLDDYLIGVVAAEMPASFNVEALKVQAVIARTNVLLASKVMGGEGLRGVEEADISSDPKIIQGWLSNDKMKEKWESKYREYYEVIKKAVTETDSKVLVFKDGLIKALFHSTCGGGTLSAEEVWGQDIPYLQSQSCNYCQFSPYWVNNKIISIKEFRYKLGLSDSFPFDQQYTKGEMLKVADVGGNLFSSVDLRSKLQLNSYKINFNIDKVTITNKGYGHGVGLCQYGAEGLARGGKKYQEILKYYYKGIEIVNKDIVPRAQLSEDPPTDISSPNTITDIRNIRFGIHTDENTNVLESRIVIEASQAVGYTVKHNDKSAVIEILLTVAELRMIEGVIPVEGDLVKSIDRNQLNPNTVRVKINLLKNVKVDIFTLGENISDSPPLPYRIVIDLQSVTQPKPNIPPETPKPPNPPSPNGQPLKGKIIVVDPGHGGKDSGAIGIKGLQEKDVVLTMGLKLKGLLEAAGAKVVMTRSTNNFISLPNRTTLANKVKADIFVAIHSNSSTAESGRGLETYYYSGSKKGMELAASIQKRLVAGLGWPDRKIKTAGFYVIKYSNMPACLVEVGFVSNSVEGNWLAILNNRYKAASLIYQGIIDYYK